MGWDDGTIGLRLIDEAFLSHPLRPLFPSLSPMFSIVWSLGSGIWGRGFFLGILAESHKQPSNRFGSFRTNGTRLRLPLTLPCGLSPHRTHAVRQPNRDPALWVRTCSMTAAKCRAGEKPLSPECLARRPREHTFRCYRTAFVSFFPVRSRCGGWQGG